MRWSVVVVFLGLVIIGARVSESVTEECDALVFIWHESSLRANVRSPASSARGYAQATDQTWRDFQRATGGWTRRRNSLVDAVAFVKWYNRKTEQILGVYSREHKYLAYHEGWAGYRRGQFPEWLRAKAKRVALTNCLRISILAASHM